MQSSSTDQLSPVLRTVTIVESLVLLAAGVGLLLLADFVVQIWAWPISIGTSRFLGAVYLAALVAVGSQALRNDWKVAHAILPMIWVFTTVILIVSLIFLGGFLFERPVAWAWLIIYIVLPVNSTIFLRQYWGRPVPDAIILSGGWLLFLRVYIAVHVLYALALLIAPGPVTSWWPWTVEVLDARIYSAQFLTLAAGGWVLTRPTHRHALRTIGWMQVTLSVFVLAGRGLYSLMQGHLNFALGTIVWHAYFVLVLLVGISLIRAARQ